MAEQNGLIPYLAGVFDGEGCISITKSYEHRGSALLCHVRMCNKEVPELFQKTFGGSLLFTPSRNERWRDLWSWQVACKVALAFLTALEPYLIVKKSHASLGIEFQEARRRGKAKTKEEAEFELYCRDFMLELNTRGNR